jgi:hypothetical protein
MADLPVAMLKNGRQADQGFRPDEYLYRRVPLELWDDGDDPIEIDAIELPDMSVIRGKYGHPEWARLQRDDYWEWGVVGFEVRGIPPKLWHLGVFCWTFAPRHVPLHNNYPHSEVWAHESSPNSNVERHIDAKRDIDPDLHLRWREMLLRNIRKFIRPHQPVAIRQAPPEIA